MAMWPDFRASIDGSTAATPLITPSTLSAMVRWKPSRSMLRMSNGTYMPAPNRARSMGPSVRSILATVSFSSSGLSTSAGKASDALAFSGERIEPVARPRRGSHGHAGRSKPPGDLAADRAGSAGDPRNLPGIACLSHRQPQSTKGSCTRMVSSRFGLVESSATGAPISSSSRRTYLMHCAGSSAQERAPRVDSVQPSMVS